MKSKIYSIIAVLIIAVAFVSCKSTGTKDNKVPIIEPSSIDSKKIKNDIVEMIMALPENSETVKLINETGAAYIAGLTHDNLNVGNILTRAASAKAYGVVLFDMAYANTYNQANTFSKLLDVNEALVKKLGFQGLMNIQKDYQDRYKASKDVRDSVDQIVTELLASTNEYIQENGSATDISLVFAGATTKSIYVTSNVTIFAMNNIKLVDLMKNQQERLESAIKILELSGDDQEVKKMADALKPVLEVYTVSTTFDLDAIEKIKDLTSFVMK